MSSTTTTTTATTTASSTASTPKKMMKSGATIDFEGCVYDLTNFQHPGGNIIRGAYLTDATPIIHSYHPNIEKIRKAIAPYRVSGDPQKEGARYQGPLYAELKRKVHAALQQQSNPSPGADMAMRIKMIALVAGYLGSLIWVALASSQKEAWLAAVFLGTIGASVGMNVMHDASHMAIETTPGKTYRWNYIWQLSGDMIGLSTLGWRYQHVIQHHIHTDNEEDPDAAFVYPLLRSSEHQKHLAPLHYFQAIMLLVLTHSLIVLFQIFDTVHVLTGVYTWEGLRKPAGTTHTKQEWFRFVVAKICLAIQWGTLWYKGGVIAWGLFCVTGSALLSSIDTPGHYTTHPPLPPHDKLPPSIQEGDAIDCWLLEQLHGTNSFAPHLNGYFGGLNMQIEHHLFPRFSHRHYPTLIRPILMEFCKEHGLPYNDYTLAGALLACVERILHLSFPKSSPTKKID